MTRFRRELLNAAFIVAGRAGSAMGAELGTMRVTEQIDALEVMATDPVHYLVVPRVGGREDYAALFHEGGHAEHYANVDPGLPVEFRRDRATTA